MMKNPLHSGAARRFWPGWLALAWLTGGCYTPAALEPGMEAFSLPASAGGSANVYRSHTRLPVQVRRVAVLPVAADSTSPEADAGQETLDPVLHAELARCKKFELVFVSTGQLQQWTGRARWKAEEKLPFAFFQKLRDELGCDAVLFSRLSHYRPYAPLRMGWNLKLVDSEEPRIWWSVDEMFDAGEPATARAAQRFYQKNLAEESASSDAATILVSPRRFGQFAIHAALATLPER